MRKVCKNIKRCPCLNHALNNSLAQLAKITLARNSIAHMKAIIIRFWNWSAKRIFVFKKHLKNKFTGLCETRLAGLVNALNEICTWTDAKSASEAKSLLLSIDGEFIVAVCTLSDILDITCPLSLYLQTKNISLVDANHAVKAALTVLNNMRTNAEDDFKKIFDHACQISDSLSPPVQISLPRMARVQKHRENYHSSTPETYFRVSLFIPLLDNIIDDLSNRLPPETLNIFNLNVILPRVMGTNDEKNEEEQLRQILTDYGAILDTHSITLMGEYRVWKEH